jgi:predicted kinase
MPKCYQLIGVPGSGKSTWIKNQSFAKDCAIVSTDEHVENHAKFVGKTYSEVFKDYMPTAVNLMTFDVVKAREAGKDIIWDQTSTSVLSRKRKFNMLPGYEHIAVVFKTPPAGELVKRLASRPGKIIPWDIVSGMINKFEMPTKEEGFSEIIHVDNV